MVKEREHTQSQGRPASDDAIDEKLSNAVLDPIALRLSESGDLIASDSNGDPVTLDVCPKILDLLSLVIDSEPKEPPTPGTVMPDGTLYAGISPDTGKPFYTTPKDVPILLDWHGARKFARESTAHDNSDWRVPTAKELEVLYTNRKLIKGFDLYGTFPDSWYWSSSKNKEFTAWFQRFSDGVKTNFNTFASLSVRCVRG